MRETPSQRERYNTMMRETKLVRTVNGTQYNYKATRVRAIGSEHSQKVYGFGTDYYPSGSRTVVRVWDTQSNRMVVRKIADYIITEAEVFNYTTKETFIWKGEARVRV